MDSEEEACRLCVRNSTTLSDVSIEDENLIGKLDAVFNFPILMEENLPVRVCSECFSKISEFHSFSEAVWTNQEQLKSKKQKQPERTLFVDVNQEPEERVISDSKEVVSDKAEGQSKSADKALSEEETPKRQKEEMLIQKYFPLKCDSCSLSFEQFCEYKRHLRKKHSQPVRFNCCGKDLVCRKDLLKHIVQHRFKCDICEKKFSSFFHLRHHQQLHSTAERPFRCDKCDRSFSKKRFLLTHIKEHDGFQCQICNETLSRPSILRKHITDKHGIAEEDQDSQAEQKLICPTCGKQYSRLSMNAFTKHVQQHTGEYIPDQIQCPVCDYVTSKGYLKKHIALRHNDEDTSIECNVCHQVFPNLRILTRHKYGVHTEKKFQCDLCDLKCKHRTQLKRHRASVHTGEKLYSCDLCGMTTKYHHNLNTHRLKLHPELQAKEQNDQIME